MVRPTWGRWTPGIYARVTPKGSYELTQQGWEEFNGRVAAGKNPASLVLDRWPRLYKLAKELVGFDEVVAEGWLALWHAVVTYRGGCTLTTWAIHTARSKLQDLVENELRYHKRHGPAKKILAYTVAPDAPVIEADDEEFARRAVQNLVPQQRDVVTSLLDGLTPSEHAQAHGFSRQYADHLLKKARQRLASKPELQNLL